MLGNSVRHKGVVAPEEGRRKGDRGKTAKVPAGAPERAKVERNIAKQVNKVEKMEKDLLSLEIKPHRKDGFLDPAKPVRQYIEYRHDKANRWKGDDKFPDEYNNIFSGNSRTGKQWHDRFGNIVNGRPAR